MPDYELEFVLPEAVLDIFFPNQSAVAIAALINEFVKALRTQS